MFTCNRPIRFFLFSVLCALLFFAGSAAADDSVKNPRPITIDDYFHIDGVSGPQLSPNGQFIAYSVSKKDVKKNKSRSRIWMVSVDGGQPVAMTAEDESSSHPRWSPDGRYLAFLSSRDDGETQVWQLYRGGGEAVQLTDTVQSVNSFEWSPDSSRLLLTLQDPTEKQVAAKKEGEADDKADPVWVIDRKQFKTDYVGYLDRRRTHIYAMNIADQEMIQLTSGDYDDSGATWSPDGKFVAFTSNRSEDPDSNYNTDIWIVASDKAGQPVQVTRNPGPDANPAWSPDGKTIVHTANTDTQATGYATQHLAVSSIEGDRTDILTQSIDRMIYSPRYSPDGQSIWFLLEDQGEQNLVRVNAGGDQRNFERLVRGEDVVAAFAMSSDGAVVAQVSRPHLPAELFQLTDDGLEQRTFTNQKVLERLTLGAVERVEFNSKDGTRIQGFVIKPPGFKKGKKYPIVLDIHGGPQAQYDYSFSFDAQLLAANGYLVVHPNPRGSTGYGEAFCKAIWQDWGGPDYDDVMASVDDVIDRGWGDPDRMAVMGWSYGGMLTNHVITKTDRFKAAASGASATLYVANYGHDMYQRWWDQELGYPWEPEARARYERISPFNQLGKVVTPTLILGGELDWNVPILNSEQLYLALKKLGVDTQLIVYPGQYHGIGRPTYVRDLYQRHLDWFAKYVLAE